jgi:hypothetical protein
LLQTRGRDQNTRRLGFFELFGHGCHLCQWANHPLSFTSMKARERIESESNSPDVRRIVVLILAVGLLVACGVLSWRYGPANVAAGGTGRIGLVLGALWLAWPSLRRPAQWLPPGFAVMGVLALVFLAARPRMIIVVIPALGVLLALGTIIRIIKR